MVLTEDRLNRLKDVVKYRQFNLTIILENVHDPHNIGAVLRTCDSVGIREVFLLYTDPKISSTQIKAGKSSSSGANKWIKTHHFKDVRECFTAVKKNYTKIYGTHLSSDSVSLYDLDLTESIALMFGNEHSGISEEALKMLDGNFEIPQLGFVKSLNISVACAVSLYEVLRQRIKSDKLNHEEWTDLKTKLLSEYTNISRPLTKK